VWTIESYKIDLCHLYNTQGGQQRKPLQQMPIEQEASHVTHYVLKSATFRPGFQESIGEWTGFRKRREKPGAKFGKD